MILHFMGPEGLCSIIYVDLKNQTVKIENKTDLLIHRAFGINEDPTWEDFLSFLHDRCFPKTRDKMKIALKQVGVDFFDPFEIIRKTKGRMAEDKQWIKFVDEQSMKEFTQIPLNSEGVSSKGNQLKWHEDDWWYKTDYLGYEALSEFMVSRLLQKSNVNAIHYSILNIRYNQQYFVGCKSRNLLLPNQELITLQKLYLINRNASLVDDISSLDTENKIKYVVDFVKEVTGLQEFGAYLTSLLELDALFLNEDRHTNNIAVLYNHKDNTYSYCPVFDNGGSLFSDTSLSFPLNQDVYQCLKTIKAKPFCEDFDEQVEAAENLYGIQFGYWFDSKDIVDALNEVSMFYPQEVLERMEETLREQLRKYLYLKKQAPLNEQIKNAVAEYSKDINIIKSSIDKNATNESLRI